MVDVAAKRGRVDVEEVPPPVQQCFWVRSPARQAVQFGDRPTRAGHDEAAPAWTRSMTSPPWLCNSRVVIEAMENKCITSDTPIFRVRDRLLLSEDCRVSEENRG